MNLVRQGEKTGLESAEEMLGGIVRQRCSSQSRELANTLVDFFLDRPSSVSPDADTIMGLKLAIHLEHLRDRLTSSDVSNALIWLDRKCKWRPTVKEILDAIEFEIGEREQAERREARRLEEANRTEEPPATPEEVEAFHERFREVLAKVNTRIMPAPAETIETRDLWQADAETEALRQAAHRRLAMEGTGEGQGAA